MQTEIKFRFFVPGHGFAYGTLKDVADGNLICEDGIGKVSFDDPMMIVDRYLGRNDSAGQEVYERDIVVQIETEHSDPPLIMTGIIQYDAKETQFTMEKKWVIDPTCELHIVGNIHTIGK
jgi:hypothetical protein